MPVRLATDYGESQAGNYAAGLAFNAFMSMFPLLLGLLAIVGFVVRSATVEAQIQTLIVSAFPAEAHGTLLATLRGAKESPGLLGLISIGGLLWTGTGLFAAMEFALDEIFGVRQRDFIRQRLMGVAMIAVFVVAIVLAVAANALLAAVKGFAFAGPVLAAVVLTALFLVIYRVVPNRAFRFSEIWPGAVLAGILTEILTLAFPIYAGLMHGFNSYGTTFALFFLLAGWLYFLCQFMLLGAVLNRLRLPSQRAEGAFPPRSAGGRAGEVGSGRRQPA